MKRILVLALIALALVIGVGAALADAPTVSIDPIGALSYATFPQTYNVTGTLTHDPNVSSVSQLKLYINDVQEGATLDPESGNDTTIAFSLPWAINGPGTYTVKVTARHGNNTGTDEEVVEVSQTIVVGQYPAAPSIAADYLQSLGIKAGSRTFKNIVSLVALHMGPTTEFDGLTADNAGYAGAVEAYVDGVIAAPVSK